MYASNVPDTRALLVAHSTNPATNPGIDGRHVQHAKAIALQTADIASTRRGSCVSAHAPDGTSNRNDDTDHTTNSTASWPSVTPRSRKSTA